MLLLVHRVNRDEEGVLLEVRRVRAVHLIVLHRLGARRRVAERVAQPTEAAPLLIRLLLVALRPEHRACRNALGTERRGELLDVAREALHAHGNRIQPVGIPAFGSIQRESLDLLALLQQAGQHLAVSPAILQIPVIHLGQLHQPDGRLHLRQAIVEANHVVDVRQLRLQIEELQALRHVVAVVAERAAQPRHILVIGDHAATLATGREVLALAEGEGADIPDGAGALALILRAVGLGAVLNHEEIVLLRDLEDRAHVRHDPIEVYWQDRARSLADRRLDGCRVQRVALLLHIREDGNRARLADREGGSNERVGRHDHFIARADPEPGQCRVQRARAVTRRDAVARATPLGELLLELHANRSGPVVHLTTAKRLHRRLDRLLIEVRPSREWIFGDRCTTLNREFLRHEPSPCSLQQCYTLIYSGAPQRRPHAYAVAFHRRSASPTLTPPCTRPRRRARCDAPPLGPPGTLCGSRARPALPDEDTRRHDTNCRALRGCRRYLHQDQTRGEDRPGTVRPIPDHAVVASARRRA